MSLLLQIALGALVVGGIGFGVWNSTYQEKTQQVQQERKIMNNQVPSGVSTNAVLTTGTTNADLDKDMTAIDAQLKIVNENSTSVDQSMNDKQVMGAR